MTDAHDDIPLIYWMVLAAAGLFALVMLVWFSRIDRPQPPTLPRTKYRE